MVVTNDSVLPEVVIRINERRRELARIILRDEGVLGEGEVDPWFKLLANRW